jgi:GntR family transcriptional repressor for pyruvate dehydrogenase complex
MPEEIYRKFTQERLYDKVADYIEELIGAGKLQVGDQLPPERELTKKLGVARGVIREAIKVLVARGLVTVEPGRGTFIAQLDTASISDHLGRFFRIGKQSHHDLNELRRVLEVEIAALAAQRAAAKDLAEMGRAIEAMDQGIDSPEEYISADQAFHAALARATQNSLFPLLINVIADLLQESRRIIFHQVPGAPQRGQYWHRQIYAAVEQHQWQAAREAMRFHMQQVSEDAEASIQAHGVNHLEAELEW